MASKGLVCHATTSSITASVTFEISEGFDLDFVNFRDVLLNLARRQAARIQRKDLLVET